MLSANTSAVINNAIRFFSFSPPSLRLKIVEKRTTDHPLSVG